MKNSIIQIYTGDGKGKTTAAFGQALRAIGAGYSVYIIQFLKTKNTSEYKFCTLNNIYIKSFNSQDKFVWDMDNDELDILKKESLKGFDFLKHLNSQNNLKLIVLDEIIWAISMNFIDLDEFIEFSQNRRSDLDLVLTGRNAQRKLIDFADLVTEMNMIKHPYEEGKLARKGIEF